MRLKFFYIIMPSVIFAADQLSKIWVRSNFFLGQSKPFLPFMDLTYVTNTGTAFGLARGNNLFFILLSAAVIAVIAVLKKRIFYPTKLSMFSYAFILGGAFGNLADRILFGYVTDFLDLRFWPVFNIADSFITVGISLFIFESVFYRKSNAPDTI